MCERAACDQTWPAGPGYRDRVASLRITVPQCTQGRPGDSSEEPPGRGVKMVRITGSPILAKQPDSELQERLGIPRRLVSESRASGVALPDSESVAD